ncbi:MAG: acyl-CoA dehydrogenase family protein [Pseudomonadota bacterium]
MDFQLSFEHSEIQRVAREFTLEQVVPRAAEIDERSCFDLHLYGQLADLGFVGMLLPESYGGSASDNLGWCLVIEELAKGSAAIANSLVTARSIGDLIGGVGNEHHKRTYLPPLAAGKSIVSFCLTEPGSGSDAASLRTSAKLDGNHYVLNGEKTFITLGAIADVVAVAATLDSSQRAKAIRVFLVPGDTPGLSRSKKLDLMGIRGMETCALSFQDCRVPRENILGEDSEGFKAFMKALEGGRLGIAAMATGLAQAALDHALPYAMERKQFGKPIAEMQAIETMLADMAADIEAARLMTYRAAWLKDQGHGDFNQAASLAKLFASEICEKHVSNAMQIFGGYGYSKEYPIERFYRDARIHKIWDGTSQIQRIIISRYLRRGL